MRVTPRGKTARVTRPAPAPLQSLVFAASAWAVAAEAHRLGLEAPAFRSRPGVQGADRTLRRVRGGGAVVAVRTGGRPMEEVVVDLAEGVVALNGLRGGSAHDARSALVKAGNEAAASAARMVA
jgi:hypothetical protein